MHSGCGGKWYRVERLGAFPASHEAPSQKSSDEQYREKNSPRPRETGRLESGRRGRRLAVMGRKYRRGIQLLQSLQQFARLLEATLAFFFQASEDNPLKTLPRKTSRRLILERCGLFR